MRPFLDIRQFLDTRGGKATLIIALVVTVGMAALVGLLQPVVFPDSPVSFTGTTIGTTVPLAIMLPILAVLIIAADWSNNSVQTTFLQRPHRGAVLVSKTLAVVVLSAVVLAVAVLASWLATVAGGAIGSHGSSFGSAGDDVATLLVTSAGSMVFGIAVAALLQSTPLALIAAIAVPFILSTASSLIKAFAPDWLADAFSVIDVTGAFTNITAGGFTALNGVCIALMVVVPFVFGAIRWQRREVN